MIPDNAKLRYITRAPKRDDVAELRKRVNACFEFVMSPPLTNSSYLLHHLVRPLSLQDADTMSSSATRMMTLPRILC